MNVRIFWLVWCGFWALGWMTIGWFIFPINLLMIPLSLVLMLVPIGRRTDEFDRMGPTERHYRYQINERPDKPNSAFDTRFTQEERDNYYGKAPQA